MSDLLRKTVEKLAEKESTLKSGKIASAFETEKMQRSIAKAKRRIERIQKEAAKPAPKE